MHSGLMKACLSHPGGLQEHSNQKALISEIGDIQKTSDKLAFLLVGIKFPHAYDETQ